MRKRLKLPKVLILHLYFTRKIVTPFLSSAVVVAKSRKDFSIVRHEPYSLIWLPLNTRTCFQIFLSKRIKKIMKRKYFVIFDNLTGLVRSLCFRFQQLSRSRPSAVTICFTLKVDRQRHPFELQFTSKRNNLYYCNTARASYDTACSDSRRLKYATIVSDSLGPDR